MLGLNKGAPITLRERFPDPKASQLYRPFTRPFFSTLRVAAVLEIGFWNPKDSTKSNSTLHTRAAKSIVSLPMYSTFRMVVQEADLAFP